MNQANRHTGTQADGQRAGQTEKADKELDSKEGRQVQ